MCLYKKAYGATSHQQLSLRRHLIGCCRQVTTKEVNYVVKLGFLELKIKAVLCRWLSLRGDCNLMRFHLIHLTLHMPKQECWTEVGGMIPNTSMDESIFKIHFEFVWLTYFSLCLSLK